MATVQPEELLHYVWKNRLFGDTLPTTEGGVVQVIDVGTHNHDSGPDFFNAKVMIDEILWVGDVEIHTIASDWERHRHGDDPHYNSVILHAVETADRTSTLRPDGSTIPIALLRVPPSVKQNMDYLLDKNRSYGCLPDLYLVPQIEMTSWMIHLLSERMASKAHRITSLLALHENDWEEVLHITLCRAFGFGLNNDAFELLARSLPFKVLRKHNDVLSDIEALLFGQAGLLSAPTPRDDYEAHLQMRYRHLSTKYGLQPQRMSNLRWARTRPYSFPEVRLAQLAKLIHRSAGLFSKIIATKGLEELRSMMQTSVSFYWRTAFRIGERAPSFTPKRLSSMMVDILLINTIIPIRFAYFDYRHDEEKLSDTLSILEEIPAEHNTITKHFVVNGVRSESAFDSQALIQLKREYCDKRRCIQCRIGLMLLRLKAKKGDGVVE